LRRKTPPRARRCQPAETWLIPRSWLSSNGLNRGFILIILEVSRCQSSCALGGDWSFVITAIFFCMLSKCVRQQRPIPWNPKHWTLKQV
jgi:hypothetical protein